MERVNGFLLREVPMYNFRNLEYLIDPLMRSGTWLRERKDAPNPLLVVLVIVLGMFGIYAVVKYFQIPYWPPGQSTILAAGGCADLDVEPATIAPLAPLEEAEAFVRNELESANEVDPASMLGDLHWSKYGHVKQQFASPRSTRLFRTGLPRWVLIFENEHDDRWLYRHVLRNPDQRLTAIYRTDTEEIEEFCTGRGT